MRKAMLTVLLGAMFLVGCESKKAESPKEYAPLPNGNPSGVKATIDPKAGK